MKFRTTLLFASSFLSVLTITAIVAVPAKALTIDATFDTSITSLADASTIEATINQTLDGYDNLFSNNETVNIGFEDMGSGLGSSTTTEYPIPYQTYYNDLSLDKTGSGDTAFLNFIKPESNGGNPVNGNANIDVTSANTRAIGINGANGFVGFNGGSGNFDSVVGLNLSIIDANLGTPLSNEYSLSSVVSHELDEALGVGSALDANNNPTPDFNSSNPIEASDLYRYSSNGVRSYTITSSTPAYFSLNGGQTDLEEFNTTHGADYNDWASAGQLGGAYGSEWDGGAAFVQNAYGSPGTNPQISANSPEGQELQAFGYNLSQAPAPEAPTSIIFSILLAFGGLLLFKKKSANDSAL